MGNFRQMHFRGKIANTTHFSCMPVYSTQLQTVRSNASFVSLFYFSCLCCHVEERTKRRREDAPGHTLGAVMPTASRTSAEARKEKMQQLEQEIERIKMARAARKSTPFHDFEDADGRKLRKRAPIADLVSSSSPRPGDVSLSTGSAKRMLERETRLRAQVFAKELRALPGSAVGIQWDVLTALESTLRTCDQLWFDSFIEANGVLHLFALPSGWDMHMAMSLDTLFIRAVDHLMGNKASFRPMQLPRRRSRQPVFCALHART